MGTETRNGKLTGWLIYVEEEAHRNQRAIELFKEAGEKAQIRILLRIYRPDQPLTQFSFKGAEDRKTGSDETGKPDFVINRSRSCEVGQWFEQDGIRVFNTSEVTRICNDKITTLEFAEALGVPVLPWKAGGELEFCSGKDEIYPQVAKSCDGHGGSEVFWVEDQNRLQQIKNIFSGRRWMLQQAASEPGKDLRVYILGGEIVKAMLRFSDTDFRSNFCLGGSAKEYEMSVEQKALVQKITDALELDYAGVDFLFHEGKLVLNEIEDVVGARMIYTNTGMNIIAEYVSYIKKTMIAKPTEIF